MRLKEIKPGMAIHCTTREHVEYLIDNGFVDKYFETYKLPIWLAITKFLPSKRWMPEVSEDGETGKHYYESEGFTCVEFSDLIIPELTAEEALHIFGDICGNVGCSRCPFDSIIGDSDCPTFLLEHYKEAAEICAKWKSDHEKKSLEIETVDICRIIEVLQDGKSVVYEEDLTGIYGSTKEEEAQEILKKYITEHEGNYIAVVEHVCRVKE